MEKIEGTIVTDEQLIAGFLQSGDAVSIETLVGRHMARVRAMVYQMVLDDADADDVTQEVFIRALRGLPRFRNRCRFSTWLYTITMNTTRSFLDARRRAPFDDVDRAPDAQDSEVRRPDRSALNAELDQEIHNAIAELPPRLRSVLILTTLHGVGVAETARIEGCAVATVYWRIHKARKRLKQLLARYLES